MSVGFGFLASFAFPVDFTSRLSFLESLEFLVALCVLGSIALGALVSVALCVLGSIRSDSLGPGALIDFLSTLGLGFRLAFSALF